MCVAEHPRTCLHRTSACHSASPVSGASIFETCSTGFAEPPCSLQLSDLWAAEGRRGAAAAPQIPVEFLFFLNNLHRPGSSVLLLCNSLLPRRG